jgi:hypothetical protein
MPALTHPWRIIAAVALVATLVVAAAACSSDDGDGSAFGDTAPPGGTEQIRPTDGETEGRDEAGRSGNLLSDDDTGVITGASGPAQPPLPSQLDRKIVRTATISLETENVGARFEDVGNIAAANGGYVSSSTFGRSDERQTASVTIRVPSTNYQSAVDELRRLGEVREESSNANDVTEEYTDLESRMRHLRATEAQYLEFLTEAEDINTVLMLQDRLNAVRLEIEQIQGRINLLQNTTDLATITVHLEPLAGAKPAPEGDGGVRSPLEVGENAFWASIEVLLGIAVVVVAVAAFSWWLIPLAIVGFIFGRRAMRHQRPQAG